MHCTALHYIILHYNNYMIYYIILSLHSLTSQLFGEEHSFTTSPTHGINPINDLHIFFLLYGNWHSSVVPSKFQSIKRKNQFLSGDKPVLSVPWTSGQAWYRSKSWDSSVHESTRDTGLPQSPDPLLYVKVKGAPLKGQGTGPSAGSARNMENKLASPVISPHIWSRLFLESQKAAMTDTSCTQQQNIICQL